MSKTTFYPGPSRIYSNITEYIYEAYKDGILSFNHRSPEFMELHKNVKELFHSKLNVPKDYDLMFVSSATESWEIIGQSLINEKAQSFYNGSFGQKWADYTEKLGVSVNRIPFDLQEDLPVEKVDKTAEWLLVTHNETSNGTAVSMERLKKLKKHKSNEQLVAIDATSSMAGVALDFRLGDVWFASVQKCFGLPAGMGVMIVSPNAVEKAKAIGENNHYNSFLNVLKHHRNFQTHFTPNILLIFLLQRTLEVTKGIDYLDEKLKKRYKGWDQFLEEFDSFDWLVRNKNLRSTTVFALTCTDPEKVKKKARDAEIVIGSGYGEWKNNTIRLANFPAIKGKEIEKLTKFLRKNFD